MKPSRYGNKVSPNTMRQYLRPANWTVNGVNFIENETFNGVLGTYPFKSTYYEIIDNLSYYDVENNSTYYDTE